MLTLASVLYLPDHLMTMSKRAYYYFAGDAAPSDLPEQVFDTIAQTTSKASEALLDAATTLAETAYQAAAHTAAAAQGATSHTG